jgi:hypothetical protein
MDKIFIQNDQLDEHRLCDMLEEITNEEEFVQLVQYTSNLGKKITDDYIPYCLFGICREKKWIKGREALLCLSSEPYFD